jgi:hypothetical protein
VLGAISEVFTAERKAQRRQRLKWFTAQEARWPAAMPC